jgi:ketosteroid isomerase-like protein
MSERRTSCEPRRFPLAVALWGLLITACSRPPASPPRSPRDDEQAVAGLQRSWLAAFEHGDIPAIEALLAPEFVNVAADGSVNTRDAELAPVRAGTVKFSKTGVEELQVRVFGDAAIATGIAAFAGTFGDRPFSGRERFTDVWIRRDGAWQVVASHNSRAR